MSRIDLQPATAQARIATAQTAGSAAAGVVAGPIATGALSTIDAIAGLVEVLAVTEDKTRAIAVLAQMNSVGAAATTGVTDLVAIDETNAQQLADVGGDV